MTQNKSTIEGNLDIFIAENEDTVDGIKEKWNDILIHGDPDGLRSLARILIALANTNQNDINELPVGARDHIQLRPKFELSNSSEAIIVGRLDAKGTGMFYKRFVPREK